LLLRMFLWKSKKSFSASPAFPDCDRIGCRRVRAIV
jgi:hypothetical protein